MNRVSLFFCILLPSYCHAYNFGNEDYIVEQLLHDKIVNVQPLNTALGKKGKIVLTERKLFLITLRSGIQGVYKPLSKKDRPMDERQMMAEVAAYKASSLLGFSLVPPTVIRAINGVRGSLQFFVKTNIDPMVPGMFNRALTQADQDELATLKIFYYVFGRWSNLARNFLLDYKNGKFNFIGIDNEGMWRRKYWRYGENAFVYCHWKGLKVPKSHARSFPYDRYYTIHDPDASKIKEQFGSEISAYYLEKFCHVNPLKYIYYDDALWVNLKGNAPCFAFTNRYPEETISKIKTIDYPMLYTIFSDAQDAGFVTDEFLDFILDRRDQVLARCNQLN